MTDDAVQVKDQLRQTMLAKRRSLPKETVTAKSRTITEIFCDWPLYKKAACIMVYLNMPDEPQTDAIINAALACGKTVCVPLLGPKYGEMTAARISGLDDLVTGRLGLKMPDPVKAQVVAPETIDIVLVPGVAFDLKGNRVGMGAGYYDRYLAMTQCPRIGLAWSFQICGSVPAENHDVRMDYLLSENGVITVQ